MQNRLIELRKSKNVTQSNMANLLQISVDDYNAKETGTKEFEWYELYVLSVYLDKPIDYIFLPVKFDKSELLN